MKDAVHHLKHVQKKVIQSARKSQVNEENLQTSLSKNTTSTSIMEPPARPKRRQLTNQLRKTFVRIQHY